MAAATHFYTASDMLQTTPGFFTAAIAAADESENPFEKSFKLGNSVIERSKEQQQQSEEGHLRDSNNFLRIMNEGNLSPLFGFSPRSSPAPYINNQFLSLNGYNTLPGSSLAQSSVWPGPKQEKALQYDQGPVIYRQEPSPPNSADRSPENWLFTDYQTQHPMHSPLHAILTQNMSQETRTQYGQVTPPDDQTPVVFDHPDPPEQIPPQKKPQSNTVSKRKRTLQSNNDSPQAAPAKRSRKNGKSRSLDQSSVPDSPKPDDAKRSKFLERNRVAASKCRQKKKEWTSNLETRARELQNSKNQLALMVGSLKDEVLFLKGELLRHTGCGCEKIREYLNHEVHAMAYPGDSEVFESAASPVGSAPSSGVGSVSAASLLEESSSTSFDDDAGSGSPAGKQSMEMEEPEEPCSPPPHFKVEKELEALLTDQLVQDTSSEGIAARVQSSPQ
ncbi:hypothetical protein MMC08_008661 [Hypocenomyce scalaris]|nr:hypothetical protein [Hypocenomyce scalaris]